MTNDPTIRQGAQLTVEDLRIGVVAAGDTDGEPAARLLLRDDHKGKEVLLFRGQTYGFSDWEIELLGTEDDPTSPGTGSATLRVTKQE